MGYFNSHSSFGFSRSYRKANIINLLKQKSRRQTKFMGSNIIPPRPPRGSFEWWVETIGFILVLPLWLPFIIIDYIFGITKKETDKRKMK